MFGRDETSLKFEVNVHHETLVQHQHSLLTCESGPIERGVCRHLFFHFAVLHHFVHDLHHLRLRGTCATPNWPSAAKWRPDRCFGGVTRRDKDRTSRRRWGVNRRGPISLRWELEVLTHQTSEEHTHTELPPCCSPVHWRQRHPPAERLHGCFCDGSAALAV